MKIYFPLYFEVFLSRIARGKKARISSYSLASSEEDSCLSEAVGVL